MRHRVNMLVLSAKKQGSSQNSITFSVNRLNFPPMMNILFLVLFKYLKDKEDLRRYIAVSVSILAHSASLTSSSSPELLIILIMRTITI